MVHKDLKILSQMLKSMSNLVKWSLKHHLLRHNLYTLLIEQKETGKFYISGFEFDDNAQRWRVDAKEIFYIDVWNYVWVMKKAAKELVATSTSFQGRVEGC
jgi:hypothetical protein